MAYAFLHANVCTSSWVWSRPQLTAITPPHLSFLHPTTRLSLIQNNILSIATNAWQWEFQAVSRCVSAPETLCLTYLKLCVSHTWNSVFHGLETVRFKAWNDEFRRLKLKQTIYTTNEKDYHWRGKISLYDIQIAYFNVFLDHKQLIKV